MLDKEELWSRFWTAYKEDHHATCVELISYLRQEDSDPYLGYLHGEVLQRLGRWDAAEQLIRTHYSDSADWRDHAEISLGEICAMSGRFEEAEHWYRAAAISKPTATRNWVFLSGFLFDRGRMAEACDVLREGLRVGIDDLKAEVHLNIGKNLRALGHYIDAIKSFEEALSISPDLALAVKYLRDVRTALRLRDTSDRVTR